MDKAGNNAVYEFGRFRLDAEKLMLYRDDIEVSMPPKMVKTLLVLAESSGEILSKDELLDRVWSDAIVDESNLSQHLYHLRKVLGGLPDGRPSIETLRRRGYRFNAEVHMADAAKPAPKALLNPPSPSILSTGVERDGNVLRLVDWSPGPDRGGNNGAANAEHASAASSAKSLLVPALVVGVAVLIAVTATVAFVRYRSSLVPEASANNEILMLRLTNGIKPVDAAISPNGDCFAYHEVEEKVERLWLQQVGQASRVAIGDAPQGTFYGAKTFSPDGKFLFLSIFDENGRGALYRLASIGGPRAKILDDVKTPISFSPDGGEFVFIREDKTAAMTALVIADKDGKSQRTILERPMLNRFVGSPAWSPDGNTIVFASADPGNATGIYSIDLAGQQVKRVSEERWDNAYRIVWLPDGRGLAMIATRAGEGYSTRRDQVYFVSYPDGASRRLTTEGDRHQEWSLGATKDDAIIAIPYNRSSQIWSLAAGGTSASAIQISRGLADGRAGIAPLPDGRIAFTSRIGDALEISRMNADGTGLIQISSGELPIIEEIRPDPKGRYLVFSGYNDGVSRLYRCDLEGGKLTQLTFGDGHQIDSTISPDGEWVVYDSTVSSNAGSAQRLFRTSINGGAPQRFGDTECVTPHFSPDGGLLSCIRGDEVLLLSALDGSQTKTHKLLPYARVNFGARWTPDGRGIVYIRTEREFANLWMQPLDGGHAKQLTDFALGDIHHFAYSSDGTRLFVARGQQISDAVLLRNYR